MTSYRSPLLDRLGAVPAAEPDAGVAAHYGDPFREQRALAAGGSAVDLSHRGVVRIEGPDRLGWLHSLTTQHLEQLAPAAATTTLVLSPHGHVEHVLYGVDDGESFWAHVEPGTAPALVAFLESMKFLMRVEVADVTPGYAAVWEPAGGAHASFLTRAGGRGRDLFVPRDSLADAVGAAPAGIWAYEALRIAAHEPRLGPDTDHRTIPNEVGWIGPAVHLEKGCYRGQETVSRVYTLGRPPRRLVMLHLDGSVDRLPHPGDPVEQEGRAVGFVGSAARHYELGPIALALVKRSVPTDAELLAGGVAAAQEPVVDPEAGLHVRPRLR